MPRAWRPTLLKAAPNIQICTNHVLSGVEAIQVPNGGYLRASADQRSLLSVNRIQARRRAERRIGAAGIRD